MREGFTLQKGIRGASFWLDHRYEEKSKKGCLNLPPSDLQASVESTLHCSAFQFFGTKKRKVWETRAIFVIITTFPFEFGHRFLPLV